MNVYDICEYIDRCFGGRLVVDWSSLVGSAWFVLRVASRLSYAYVYLSSCRVVRSAVSSDIYI